MAYRKLIAGQVIIQGVNYSNEINFENQSDFELSDDNRCVHVQIISIIMSDVGGQVTLINTHVLSRVLVVVVEDVVLFLRLEIHHPAAVG